MAVLTGFCLLLESSATVLAGSWGTVEAWDEEDSAWDARDELAEMWPDRVSASSTLSEEGYDHEAYNLLDYDEETDWAEGVPGSGAGEYVDFYFPTGTELCGFSILPGFYKTRKLFLQNGAPLTVNLRMGSFTENFDLGSYAEKYGALDGDGIFFPFSSPIVVEGPIRLLVLSVREGSLYQDLCISEVHFFGESDDSFEGISDWRLDKAQALTSQQMEKLVSFCYHLYRYRRDGARAKKGTVEASSLTPEEMAYGLYWYVSQKLDDRIWASPNWQYEAAYTRDLESMLYELYGGSGYEAWDIFEEAYILWKDGDVSYVEGEETQYSGAFVFRSWKSLGLVDGSLVLSGNVASYRQDTKRYEVNRTFQAYFRPTRAKTLYGWRLERLEIN